METFQNIFDGLMLGDGCVFKERPTGNARYCHEDHHITYIKYLMTLIKNDNFSFSDNAPYLHKSKIYESENWFVQTHVHEYLTQEYFRWYKDKIKIVPKDLELTPDICRHWYIGDGGLKYDRDKLKGIKFSTNCFSAVDLKLLCRKMLKLGFHITPQKDKTCLMKIRDVEKFITYIGICPVQCYQYKWILYDREKYNYYKNILPCLCKTISN